MKQDVDDLYPTTLQHTIKVSIHINGIHYNSPKCPPTPTQNSLEDPSILPIQITQYTYSQRLLSMRCCLVAVKPFDRELLLADLVLECSIFAHILLLWNCNNLFLMFTVLSVVTFCFNLWLVVLITYFFFCSLEPKVMQNVLGSHQMASFWCLPLLMDLLRYVSLSFFSSWQNNLMRFEGITITNCVTTRYGITQVGNSRRTFSTRLM